MKFLKESWVSAPSASNKKLGPIRSPYSNGVEAKIRRGVRKAGHAGNN